MVTDVVLSGEKTSSCLHPSFNPFFRMNDCRKLKWRGVGGHHWVGWGPRVVPAWVSWHCRSSSAKTHRRTEGRRIEERHGWMEMYWRGGGIRLAQWRWRAAEGGYCQGEALLESLCELQWVWGLKQVQWDWRIHKDQELCNRWWGDDFVFIIIRTILRSVKSPV